MAWTIAITAVLTLLALVVAMNFKTPEKKLDRKIEHRYAVADPQFRREMGVLLGPGIVPGNTVQALQNGDEIFPAMLEAVQGATRTVTFETYIYWSGDVGAKFADALVERARAGVRVKVLLDWVGSMKMEDTLLQRMQDAGVEIHKYRPLRWYNLGRLNNRTHRKLLVVDGRLGFTGGVGIADQWQGHAQDADHWRDLHFRIEGPVVAQLQAAFNDNWIKTTGVVLNGVDYFPALSPVGDMAAHMFVSSPAGGSESMHLMYLMAIAAAEHTIDLEAAYFVPDDLMIQAMQAARHRGVRVRVLVPGKHIDSETVRLASKAHWGDLLLAGVEVYEYQPTMMHNKLLVVDGGMVSVGSTNFDSRSFRLNDEASLNVYDPAFAAHM
ncbi:MAG: cardiolipin synthase B, partial [Lysobacteraceae bacterium]